MTAVLTVKTPQDLIAAIPLILGFHPQESLVMCTFGAETPFHARIDIPEDLWELGQACAALIEPCVRHHVQGVVFAAYTDKVPHPLLQETLVQRFAAAGVEVHVTVLSTNDPDISKHEFAEALPRSIQRSREALAATLEREWPVPVRDARPLSADDADWMASMTNHLNDASRDDLTRFIANLATKTFREIAVAGFDREFVSVEGWCRMFRHLPEVLVDEVSSTMAQIAWLSGDGALAWIALEQAKEHDMLWGLIETALTVAMPPQQFATVEELTDGLPA